MLGQGFAAPAAPALSPPVSPGSQGPVEDLARWVPSLGDPWDARKAAHLLRRAGFGGRPEEITAMVTLGMDRCVDLLLTVPPFHPIPTYGTHVLPTGELLNLSRIDDQRAMWFWQMTTSPWQLAEKMALFWNDHFATGVGKVQYAEMMGLQVNTLRALALGKFRDLLVAVAKDPAMLYFLDNYVNTRTRPQENWGREILELFSMGVNGGYTENDVKAATRCFTGWSLETFPGIRYQYKDTTHDYTSKTLLGRVINNPTPNGEKDGYDAIETILAWPATSKYMVEKIWKYFVAENPDPALIDLLAARWVQDRFDVRSLLSIIFRSNAFYSAASIRTLVKNPVEYLIGAFRNTGTTMVSYRLLNARLARMGHDLLNYPDPSGYEDGIAWVNSMSVIERSNAMMELIRVATNGAIRAVLDPWREINRVGLATADQIVDHYLKILVDDDVPAQVRADLKTYMTKTDTGTRPFVLDAASVNLKVRGLIHLVLTLPEYHVN